MSIKQIRLPVKNKNALARWIYSWLAHEILIVFKVKDSDKKTKLIKVWAAHHYLDLQTEIIPSALINFHVAHTQIRITYRRGDTTVQHADNLT